MSGRITFRSDIQGLRGIAVALVVIFHAEIQRFGGGYVGVDIFFVISGFLITSLLVSEHDRAGRISLQGFYSRRARRILPAACVVIVCTALAVLLLLNPLSAYRNLGDLGAAALYVANLRYIRANTDYLAAATDQSVALHFWSLSVEEQFYLVWPLLIVIALAVGTRIKRPKPLLVMILGAVTAASFIAGVVLTRSDPAVAYLATTTRAWQFGVGALLGLVLPRLVRHSTGNPARASGPGPVATRRAALVAGWLGFVAILISVFAFDSATPFPGVAALLPTFGAAAVIGAGAISAGPWTVAGLLQLAPVCWLGAISYSLYLWHWPVFVLLGEHTATGNSPLRVAALLLLSVLLAAITYYCVERTFVGAPLLTRTRLRAGAIAATVSCLTLVTLGASGAVLHRDLAAGTGAETLTTAKFAEVFASPVHLKTGPVDPAPLKAAADKPTPGECLSFRTTEQAPDCVFGPADGVPVVLFGDSHANQWLTPFRTIAEKHGWRLTVLTQGSCPAQQLGLDPDFGDAGSQNCVDWRSEQLRLINRLAPEYVIVTSLNRYHSPPQQWAQGWRRTIKQLRQSGAKVIYIYDTPNPEIDVPACVSGATDDWDKCVFPLRQRQLEYVAREDAMVRDNKIKYVLNMNKYLCGPELCYAVRNGILLYRDDSHLSNTAAKLLEVPLTGQLRKQGVLR